jgi:hypothetical protein
MSTAPALSANLSRLLKRCPQWVEFRAGEARCEGYRHAIGANNGLTALAKRGLLYVRFDGGNVFRMSDAGRIAREALDAPPAPVVTIHDPRFPPMPHLANLP